MFFYKIIAFFSLFFIFYKMFLFLERDFFLSYISLSFICSFLIVKFGSTFFEKNKKNNTDTIIVGLSPDYPPFCFIENGVVVGFDVDLIYKIGEYLNKKIILKVMPFDSLLPSLQIGSVDMIASGLSVSEERKVVAEISEPYAFDSLVLISMKNKINNESDTHKKYIVNIGYTAEKYLIDKLMDSCLSIFKVKSFSDALIALKIGKGDVFLTARNSFRHLSDEFVITDIPESKNFESFVFYCNKNKSALLLEINCAIQSFISDEYIQELKKKWEMI